MVGKVLTQEQGITFELLTPEPAKKKGDPVPVVDPEAMPKHILIPEVVREPKIHYY